ncbi:unnamed protein product [Closterium sp. NIES-53]
MALICHPSSTPMLHRLTSLTSHSPLHFTYLPLTTSLQLPPTHQFTSPPHTPLAFILHHTPLLDPTTWARCLFKEPRPLPCSAVFTTTTTAMPLTSPLCPPPLSPSPVPIPLSVSLRSSPPPPPLASPLNPVHHTLLLPLPPMLPHILHAYHHHCLPLHCPTIPLVPFPPCVVQFTTTMALASPLSDPYSRPTCPIPTRPARPRLSSPGSVHHDHDPGLHHHRGAPQRARLPQPPGKITCCGCKITLDGASRLACLLALPPLHRMAASAGSDLFTRAPH